MKKYINLAFIKKKKPQLLISSAIFLIVLISGLYLFIFGGAQKLAKAADGSKTWNLKEDWDSWDKTQTSSSISPGNLTLDHGWLEETLPVPIPSEGISVYGLSATDVWVTAEVSKIYNYDGNNWNQVTNPSSEHNADIWVTNVGGVDHLWVTVPNAPGEPKVFHSINGGLNWVPFTNLGYVRALWGIDDNNVYAVGVKIYGENDERRAINHFKSGVWLEEYKESAPNTGNFSDIWGTSNGDNIWVTGSDGPTFSPLKHFKDNSWHDETLPVEYNLTGVWGTDASNVWVVGDEGRIMYFNGNWSDPVIVGAGAGVNLTDIWGSSATDIWAVGNYNNGGVTYHYNGSTWQQIIIPANPNSRKPLSLREIWGIGNGSDIFDYWTLGISAEAPVQMRMFRNSSSQYVNEGYAYTKSAYNPSGEPTKTISATWNTLEKTETVPPGEPETDYYYYPWSTTQCDDPGYTPGDWTNKWQKVNWAGSNTFSFPLNTESPYICLGIKLSRTDKLKTPAIDKLTINFSYDATGVGGQEIQGKKITANVTWTEKGQPRTLDLTTLLKGVVSTGPLPAVIKLASLMHFTGASGTPTFTDETAKIWESDLDSGTTITNASAKFNLTSLDSTYNRTLPTPKARRIVYKNNNIPGIEDFNPGINPFTIDAWVNYSQMGNTIFEKNDGAGNSYKFILRNCGIGAGNGTAYAIFELYKANVLIAKYTTNNTGACLPTNITPWNHFALERDGAIMRFFFDGVEQTFDGIPWISNETDISNNGNAYIGGALYLGGPAPANYIDEFRYVKGRAEYTASFPKPVCPYDAAGNELPQPCL